MRRMLITLLAIGSATLLMTATASAKAPTRALIFAPVIRVAPTIRVRRAPVREIRVTRRVALPTQLRAKKAFALRSSVRQPVAFKRRAR